MTPSTVTTGLRAYNLNLHSVNFNTLFWPPPGGDPPQGYSLLHDTAREGDVLTAEIIISNGADPNTPDAQGRRPLHEAAFFGHAEMVECLLAHDAFIDAPAPPFGHTALYMAVERGHHDIARLLLKKGAWAGVTDALSGQGLLHMAAAKGDTQLAGLLVAAGVSVFHEDRKGCTARDYAVRYNHCDLDRVLLKLMEHHARYCPAG